MASTKKQNLSKKKDVGQTKTKDKTKNTSKPIIVSQTPQNEPTTQKESQQQIETPEDFQLRLNRLKPLVHDSRNAQPRIDQDIDKEYLPSSYSIPTPEELNMNSENINPIPNPDIQINNEQPKEKTDLDIKEMILADTLAKITNPDVVVLNKTGKSIYECIGISSEESEFYIAEMKIILRKPISKAEKTEELCNMCLVDKRILALLIWMQVN